MEVGVAYEKMGHSLNPKCAGLKEFKVTDPGC